MKQLIQLLILKSEGIPLFSYTPNVALNIEEDDPMLVSGFMSAINQFISSTKRDQLNELGLSRGLIIIEEDKELNVLYTLYVAEEIDVSWGKKVLQAVRERFIDQYRRPLEFFSGNISQFRNFSEETEAILESFGYPILDQVINNPSDELLSFYVIDRNSLKSIHSQSQYSEEEDYLILQLYEVIAEAAITTNEELEVDNIQFLLIMKDLRSIQIGFLSESVIILESKGGLDLDMKSSSHPRVLTEDQFVGYIHSLFPTASSALYSKRGHRMYNLISDLSFSDREQRTLLFFLTTISRSKEVLEHMEPQGIIMESHTQETYSLVNWGQTICVSKVLEQGSIVFKKVIKCILTPPE
ncbi:MAG: hypothetical protein ACTSYA_09790 [Candidatus Kariarchaeaceae archaeon]